ncbi:allantoinase AllB [Sporolactobacillus putidus]|uniref:allantoinase n=1 Tax=Sporolactobacillus putidus TaxID=492735 RepID=A0A917S575_9BACL|nr:allantoinase AllB [Sporolactobacillus putidus]GGL59555.1 cyclic amidohydrolase [Sporolactobacillus putidus]
MLDLLVKNTLVVTSDDVFLGSVAVNNGKIAGILPTNTNEQADTIIDGKGCYLFPGIIDSHVHFNDPGFEWREDFSHATEAAAVGGVTTVVDMPLQNEPALTDRQIFEKKYKTVKEKALIDFAFWGGMVNFNLSKISELNDCGVVAFKTFLAPVSSDYTSLDYGRVREGLSIIKTFDGLAGFHCEDYGIVSYNEETAKKKGHVTRKDYLKARPVVAELVAVKTIIELSRESGTRVHICHVSHPQVAEAIKLAKYQGVRITAETCPHYLIFNEKDFLDNGMFFKCAPPLRSEEASLRLWDYVKDGTLDLVVSDHSPCADREKSESEGVFNAWGGISGVQAGLQIMFNEIVSKRNWSPTLISRIMAENPSKIFGMSGKKGALTLGFDADLVLVDPNAEWEITDKSLKYLNKSSAFIGCKGTGLPVCTILRGKVIVQDGVIKGKHGIGQLVRRNIC